MNSPIWRALQWRPRDPGMPDWFHARVQKQIMQRSGLGTLPLLFYGALFVFVFNILALSPHPGSSFWMSSWFVASMTVSVSIMGVSLFSDQTRDNGSLRINVLKVRREVYAAAIGTTFSSLTAHEKMDYALCSRKRDGGSSL